MEFMELPDHPYFIATQAHPEFKSRPLKPSPLFDGLIKAAKKKKWFNIFFFSNILFKLRNLFKQIDDYTAEENLGWKDMGLWTINFLLVVSVFLGY